MQKKSTDSMGSKKHGRSGKVHNNKHFTGKKGGKQIKRKGKGLNKKLRRQKRGKAQNKYAKYSQAD